MSDSANSITTITQQCLESARRAQAKWVAMPLQRRLTRVRRLRYQIIRHARQLLDAIEYPGRTREAETLAAEIIPLVDACRFLERSARRILAPKHARPWLRPLWLTGVSVEQTRDPWGVVLVVGAANYPLFLTGVQTLQALVAGNAVLIKPGAGASACTTVFQTAMVHAGFNPHLVQRLPEDHEYVAAAIRGGVDNVVLTGSVAAGRAVSQLAAEAMIPATLELSGCDAVFVLEDANLEQVARSLAFGLSFNQSATCIAPRRVFVPASCLREFEICLLRALEQTSTGTHCFSQRATRLLLDAAETGAQTLNRQPLADSVAAGRPVVLTHVDPHSELAQTDLFEPVLSVIGVQSAEQALRLNQMCPYALGATVFGSASRAATFARRIDAGCVVINDMIAPTADPRIAFGGRRHSGFGVTRGAAGLEAMTQIKSIVRQRSSWQPHLDRPSPYDAGLLHGFLQACHGCTWGERLTGIRSAVRAAMAQQKWKQTQLGVASYQTDPEQTESKTCPTNESRSSAAA